MAELRPPAENVTEERTHRTVEFGNLVPETAFEATPPPTLSPGPWRPLLVGLSGPMLIVAVCALRSPQMILQGRFWAEDTMFYGNAIHTDSFLGKVLYVYKGHLELIASFSHAIASYFNPKLAPFVTGFADLLLECCLGYMLIAFRRDLSIGYWPAMAICALLVVSPVAAEHYLNIVNSQWLASAMLFVLIALPEDRLKKHEIAVCATSVVLGLSSLGACSLCPIAALYACCRRSRPHAIVAAALLACCLIQGGLILTHLIEGRFQPIDPADYAVAPFLQIVVKHLSGVDAEIALSEWYRSGPKTIGTLSTFLVLPISLLILIANRLAAYRLSEKGLLLVSFVFIVFFNELGAVGDRTNLVGPWMMRYFFLPSLVVALIISRSKTNSSSPSVTIGHYALYVSLIVSLIDFVSNDFNRTLTDMPGSWRSSVDACRALKGPCHIRTNPDGFEVVLPPMARHPQ